MGKAQLREDQEQGVKGHHDITIDEQTRTSPWRRSTAKRQGLHAGALPCLPSRFSTSTIGEPRHKDADRFAEVEKIEAMSPEEKVRFWKNELSTAYPAATPAAMCAGVQLPQDASSTARSSTAHRRRTWTPLRRNVPHHPGLPCGRTLYRPAASAAAYVRRAPLHLFNHKFIKDIDEFYGEFRGGVRSEAKSPLTSFLPSTT